MNILLVTRFREEIKKKFMLARPLLIDSAKRSTELNCPAQPVWHGAQAEKDR
ncbi:Hypothetical protein PSEBR_m1689 [Pseudomonas brassicacearum subsp. brassicacearum NFM421]|uniref:Uncharacterized protein n=1 Tax=Pseudomonas brassicacearum (strain NFM421) TaxID=994484 RepID=F2K6E2_PSEBN|nr:Hypothetical protein PSEBR_m1689 [Pseudomonas brassicacearum subsp. brassicacearum NFM421]